MHFLQNFSILAFTTLSFYKIYIIYLKLNPEYPVFSSSTLDTSINLRVVS